MEHHTVAHLDLTLTQYLAAWNESSDSARVRYLMATWSDDSVFEDTTTRLVGRNAMAAYIAKFRNHHPGSRFIIRGNWHHRQGSVEWHWSLLDVCGEEILSGRDLADVDAVGRIRFLVVFEVKEPASQRHRQP